MQYDRALIAGKLRRWERYMQQYNLPAWEEIPDLGLYMEQVIVFVEKYLDYLPPELKEEQIITAAAINNYVRKGIIPKPERKRYYRTHIAYLIIICTLRGSINITTIPRILPVDLPEERVQEIYSSIVREHRIAATYFVEQVRGAAGNILDHENCPESAVNDPGELMIRTAIIGGFSRLMAQKLLLLEGKDLENGGSIEIE